MTGARAAVGRMVVRTRALALLALLACMASCAATPGVGGAPRTSNEPYTTVEDAERALETAEQQLADARADRRPSEPARGGIQTPPPAAPPPGLAPPPTAAPPRPKSGDGRKAEKDDGDRDEGKHAEQRSATPCEVACRAFASLQRAANAVCRLAGESDERCARARKKVTENASRVEGCGCVTGER